MVIQVYINYESWKFCKHDFIDVILCTVGSKIIPALKIIHVKNLIPNAVS